MTTILDAFCDKMEIIWPNKIPERAIFAYRAVGTFRVTKPECLIIDVRSLY